MLTIGLVDALRKSMAATASGKSSVATKPPSLRAHEAQHEDASQPDRQRDGPGEPTQRPDRQPELRPVIDLPGWIIVFTCHDAPSSYDCGAHLSRRALIE